jgi:hypothetical protein
MNRYRTQTERKAAIERGETTPKNSTLMDGRQHYAIVRTIEKASGDVVEIALNLTGTWMDTLEIATQLAARRNDQRTLGAGISHHVERIA